mgnify:CR=1 FL=1
MNKVVGIRFKPAGKIYDFSSGAFVLKRNDQVIVETEHGLSMGTVAVPPAPRERATEGRPLKKVYRLATGKDFDQHNRNLDTEKKAHTYCLKCIKDLGLSMNLFSVESNFDASKLTFFFHL